MKIDISFSNKRDDKTFLFVSLPMKGKDNDIIEQEMNEAKNKIQAKFPNKNIELIKSHFDIDDNFRNSVICLGAVIILMAKADIIYFAEGWQNARGCQIENEIARRYMENNGVMLIEEGMENFDLELTKDEIDTLKKKADEAGMSLSKYVSMKLINSIEDNSIDAIVEEYKRNKDEVQN